jgi:hypothetical protein
MPQRTDAQFYEFDIEERKTGEVKRVPIFAYWSGEHSIAERRRMCDCQLGSFFDAHPADLNTLEKFNKGSTTNFFPGAQYRYLNGHKCDHRPSGKFQVLRAHVSGDVVEIAA